MGFIPETPACLPYREEFEDGCKAEKSEDCEQCPLVRILCPDCEQFGKCDYRFKPKVLPTNRRALDLYALSLKHGALPYPGGLLNQPHKLICQFQIIANEIARQEKNERDAQRGDRTRCQ